jgi:hypothetical protein
MLNAHSLIGFTPETHFIKKYIVTALSKKIIWTNNSIAKALVNDKDFNRLAIDFNPILVKYNVSKTNELAAFFKDVLEEYIKKTGKQIIGDKDPMNAPYIKHIHKVYPEAYLLHIIRDPRDVVLSRIKSEWGKNIPFFQHVAEYHQHIKQALKDGPNYFKEKYIEIKYEDLITEPKKTLEFVCSKLDVSFEENMLSYHKSADKIVFDDEKSWKENVFKPIIKNNAQKWKRELTKTQVAKIEGGIESTMKKLGYTLSEDSNWFAKNILSLPVKLMSCAYAIKMKSEDIKENE